MKTIMVNNKTFFFFLSGLVNGIGSVYEEIVHVGLVGQDICGKHASVTRAISPECSYFKTFFVVVSVTVIRD